MKGIKETGIIMSGNHPRLILDGLKTMTRRVILPQPPATLLNPTLVSRDSASPSGYSFISDEYGEIQLKCPYGGIGDRLWVRETWFDNSFYPDDRDNVLYRADGEFQEQIPEEYDGAKWKPSIFMPRWASRILLEITGLRAERLQEISESNIIDEGCPEFPHLFNIDTLNEARFAWYKNLWDSLNAKRGYSWDFNPWVWPISFKGVKSE